MVPLQIIRLLVSVFTSWFAVGFFLSRCFLDEEFKGLDIATRIILSTSLSFSLLFFILFFLGCTGPYVRFEIVISLIVMTLTVAAYFKRKTRLHRLKSILKGRHIELPRLTGIEILCLFFSSIIILLGFFKAYTWPFMSGDALFRWHYLGLMTFKLRGFWYYPPIAPDHFKVYFMAEGMPPFVQLMYAWVYFSIDEVKEGVARLFIGFMMGLTLLCTLKLGGSLFRRRVGYISMLLLAGSSFFFNNMLSGEGALGVCFFLTASIFTLSKSTLQGRGRDRLTLIAGFLAGFSALSRYEGVFGILSGLLTLMLLKSGLKRIGSYLVGAAISLPWYLRNWIITGNPIYPYLAEVFPTNRIYYDIHVVTYRQLQTLNAFDAVKSIIDPPNLVTFGILILGGIVGLLLVLKNSSEKGYIMLSPILVFALLWLNIAPMSGGGIVGALRYLLPILPVFATSFAYLLNDTLIEGVNPSHFGRPKIKIQQDPKVILFVLVFSSILLLSSVNLLQMISRPYPGLKIQEITKTNLMRVIYTSIQFDLEAGTVEKKRLFYTSHYKLASFLEEYCKDQVVVTDQATLLPFLLRKRVKIIPTWSTEIEDEILSDDLDFALASLRRKNIRFFLLWEYGGNMNNKYFFENSPVYKALHNPTLFTRKFEYVFYWRLYELTAF